jgi:hypothetical protein
MYFIEHEMLAFCSLVEKVKATVPLDEEALKVCAFEIKVSHIVLSLGKI